MDVHDYSIDLKTRTVYCIAEETDSEVAETFIKNIAYLNRTKGTIKVVLSTSGGEVDYGIAMYESVKHSKNPVHILVTGSCQSIGILILQGAAKRSIYSTSTLMYHEGNSSQGEMPVNESVKSALYTRDQFAMIDKIIFDRVKPGISFDAFQDQVRRSIWLDGKAAKKAGYVDEVI